MKYIANWRIEGLGDKVIEPGDTYEAKPADVADLVAKEFGGNVALREQAALTPADKKAVVDAPKPINELPPELTKS